MKPGRFVTFSITLPEAGSFDDFVAALCEARQVQIDLRNIAAAQALSVVLCLADGGNAHFKIGTVPPIVVERCPRCGLNKHSPFPCECSEAT